MAAMDLDTRAALERLLAGAQGDTGQSRQVADLLLAWHNAGQQRKQLPNIASKADQSPLNTPENFLSLAIRRL
ncbi:MAG: hypothetical protein ACK561_07080 [Pseudomonadaceae bacterium]